MRTNVVIDDILLAEAMRLTGVKTKREVIELALRELINARSRLDLRDLFGQIQFADGYDYKAMRGRVFE